MSGSGSDTVSREVTIVNQRGLHARASAKFVGMVAALPDGYTVEVEKDGNRAAGGSILGLMMLGAAKGNDVVLHVTGPEAERVMDELYTLVAGGFGEE